MSHPKVVEVTRFYKDVGRSWPNDVNAPKYPSFTATRKYPGDIGYSSQVARDASNQETGHASPERKFHKRYGLGLQESDLQRKHMFTELPGTTFNSATFAKFTSTASYVRRAISPTRARSPTKH